MYVLYHPLFFSYLERPDKVNMYFSLGLIVHYLVSFLYEQFETSPLLGVLFV